MRSSLPRLSRRKPATEEIDLVAGVFTNRLERGIPLQSDPTVIYGVSKGEPLYNRAASGARFIAPNWIAKRPGTPTRLPGLPKRRSAIRAAPRLPRCWIHPTDYLFFVADGTGGHAFAKTLAEHNRNVAAYRRYEAREIARERNELMGAFIHDRLWVCSRHADWGSWSVEAKA